MANQHIVQREEGWAVRREKAGRDTAVLDTQAEAIKEAKRIADNQGGEVLIHGRDGKIRNKDTHSKVDHHPPKG
ncbi:DUF2188 domain-containing protein [Patescibacteria group bacterium]|nr:MAG: DUF2188 domain-containing protein [Patescibacteria group bacterium]